MARQFQASEVLSECLQPPPPPPPTYALNTAVRLQGVAGHQSAGRHKLLSREEHYLYLFLFSDCLRRQQARH